MQRGQITIYIALGVFVLLIFALMSRTATLAPPEFSDEARISAQQAVQSCLTQGLEEAVLVVGQNGDLDAGAFVETPDATAAILYDGAVRLPSLDMYAEQAERETVLGLMSCVSELQLPYTLTYDNLDVSITFMPDTTQASLATGLKVSTGTTQSVLSEITSEIPVAFSTTHSIMDSYLMTVASDPSHLHVDPLLFGSLSPTLYLIDHRTIIIELVDEFSLVHGYPWMMQFALQYPEGLV